MTTGWIALLLAPTVFFQAPGAGDLAEIRRALEEGKWDEARSRLEEALVSEPSRIDLLQHLAYVLAQLGEDARARSILQRVLSLSPSDAYAHRLLGNIAFREGRLEEAEGHYLRALESDPGAEEVARSLDLVREAIGRHQRLGSAWRRASALLWILTVGGGAVAGVSIWLALRHRARNRDWRPEGLRRGSNPV